MAFTLHLLTKTYISAWTLRCVAAAFSNQFGSTGAEVDPSKAAELLAAAISIAAEQVLKQSQATSGVTGLIDIKSLS